MIDTEQTTMALENWLPADRQRRLKPAAKPTVAQLRLRRRHATTIVSNAMDKTSLKMANRLIQSWEPESLVSMALEDLQGPNALLRREARRFLEVVAPDKLQEDSTE